MQPTPTTSPSSGACQRRPQRPAAGTDRAAACSQPDTAAFATFAPLSLHAWSLSSNLSGVLLGVTAAAAGLLLGSRRGAADPGCEVCLGTGTVPCFCTRYGARAAAQCAECAGTARSRCPRCRGGGTPVPAALRVPIPVRVSDGTFDRFRFRAARPVLRALALSPRALNFSPRAVRVAR